MRIIDSGLPLRLEELRGEVRMLHTRPMKDLEQVAAGIAEFEAKIKEYNQAGCVGFNGDHEMKSDPCDAATHHSSRKDGMSGEESHTQLYRS